MGATQDRPRLKPLFKWLYSNWHKKQKRSNIIFVTLTQTSLTLAGAIYIIQALGFGCRNYVTICQIIKNKLSGYAR